MGKATRDFIIIVIIIILLILSTWRIKRVKTGQAGAGGEGGSAGAGWTGVSWGAALGTPVFPKKRCFLLGVAPRPRFTVTRAGLHRGERDLG